MGKSTKTLGVLLLCAALAASSGGCASSGGSGATVTALTVEKKALASDVTLEGVLIPAETAIISSRISGQIETVSVKTGDTVKAGQIVIQLDKRGIAAQVSQAQAGVQTAQAGQAAAQGQAEMEKISLDAAQKNFDRIKVLYESGAASQSQMDDAADRLNTAKTKYANASGPSKSQAAASVSTAGANLENLQVQLSYADLKSPVDGIVTAQNAVVGETVSPGTALVTVADTSSMKLKGMVPQDLLPVLKVGQTVTLTVGIYPDAPLQGVLTAVGPTSVATGELFPVEITVPNDGSLMAGLSASASIKAEGRKGLVVPDSAIVKESGKAFVFVLKDGTAVKTEIVSGFSRSRETEVLKGLNAGDSIAVIGAGSLKDGMKVSIRK